MRRLALALALLLAGCPAPSEVPEPATPAPRFGRLARDVYLWLVTLNQGVQVPLVVEGEAVAPSAPIVAGRPGLLRVFLLPEEGFQRRELLAELVVETGGEVTVLRATADVREASATDDLDSTLNFELPPELLAEDTRWSLAVREVDGAPTAAPGPTWPEVDEELTWSEDVDDAYVLPRVGLGASAWGGTLRVHIVPVRHDADGSGRLPDTSDEQLELIRARLYALYPVREVELTVGAEYPTSIVFDSSSDPMSDLLQEMATLREERGIPFDTYVYGMVNPDPTYEEYCAQGCTAGIAYRVSNPNTSRLRSGVGLGYSGERTADTLAHEVGHNHDRGHAPCGNPGNPDTAFPYPNGGIGAWGWDVGTGELKSPGEYSDVMGYCSERWISDYQFDALWRRVSAVEGLASWEGEPQAVQVVGERSSELRPGPIWSLRALPQGESVPVRLLDGSGSVLEVLDAVRVPIEDADTATLLLPLLGPEVAGVELLDGRRGTL